MKVTCLHCATVYRVDSKKVPALGIDARCARCQGIFFVGKEVAVGSGAAAEAVQEAGTSKAPAATATIPTAPPVPESEERRESPTPARSPDPAPARSLAAPPVFGRPDPEGKARRLARALISDIVVYHPERRDRSIAEGTLRQEFREEIRKSWDEYVAQVGADTARRSPHFRDALNEILAGGRSVF